MKIDLDLYFGETATRQVEDLAKEEKTGCAYIDAWKFHGDFPSFDFLPFCGPITTLNVGLHPERPVVLDFSSVPSKEAITHISISGGNIRRHGGWKSIKEPVHISGLNLFHNLLVLKISDFQAVWFGDPALPDSLSKLAIFNPGKLDVSSIPNTTTKHLNFVGFDHRFIKDFTFLSRFSCMEVLWFEYCRGIETLPELHPQAPIREFFFTNARRLRDITSLKNRNTLEVLGFSACPLLTIEEFRCLQDLPNLKKFYASNKKQADQIRTLFPHVNVTSNWFID